ncbi:hypothetical protein D8674_001513 [Pyrus ussuriensis x Pyrus communis]|uniref:Retrotransposon Copia-like N-terminal domain-containing protein n=1 Tax=Pyrus ussuriensis x Pyrus communis TaxID=2448454 RepID=A0A5N5F755_9ROSA|nr:hypothetical protein D8674_001513 [Pyrus ussuriensis x Pyrus communis]
MAENNVPAINPNPQTTTFQPFSIVVNIKLDRTNYPLWLAQILPILKSWDLMGYVDGTLVCPPKHVAGLTTVNPAHTTWVQQDQMILNWINGSLTAFVLSVVSSKRTAQATWEALEQRLVEHNVLLVEGATVNAFVASRGRGGGRSRGGGRENYSNRGGAQRGPNPRHYNASQNNQGTGERTHSGQTTLGNDFFTYYS